MKNNGSYLKNGYDENAKWIPLVITEPMCYIPLLNCPLNITYSDYNEICVFGKTFYNFIKQLADGNISYTYFARSVGNLIALLKVSKSLNTQHFLNT